jgi:branched-chain amino acid transport system permease protein
MDVLLAGLQAGAQYAILAAALVVVFKTTGVFNFAVGTFATLGAYMVVKVGEWPIPALLVVLAACLVVGTVSVLSELLIARPMQRRLPESGAHVVVVLLLLLMVLGESTMRLLFTSQPQTVPAELRLDGDVQIHGIAVSHSTLASLGTVLVASAVAYFVLQRTRVGVAARAVAMSSRAAEVAGIPSNRFRTGAWLLAGVLAALAGFLLASSVTVAPTMAQLPMVKAIAGVALGGLTNLPGAIACSILIGVLEAEAVVQVGTWAPSILPLLLIFVMMLVRPDGLFGSRQAVRV